MTRDRVRDFQFYYTYNFQSQSPMIDGRSLVDHMWTQKQRGGNRCWHIKTGITSGREAIVHPDGRIWYLHNYSYDVGLVPDIVYKALQDTYGFVPEGSLEWSKLPTTSGFSLIQALAELDDTLAMFSAKFVRSLFSVSGLAAFNYGILPFWNDIQAIAEMVQRINSGFRDLNYEDTKVYQISTGGGFSAARGTWTVHLSGKVAPPGGTLPELLDIVGFHPDLATAWDLIPFSFVVNWFLPIGDWLESLVGRGWVESACFTGWYSTKFEGDIGSSTIQGCTPHCPASWYSRRFVDGLLIKNSPTIPLRPQIPSFKNLFNTAYLAILTLRGRR